MFWFYSRLDWKLSIVKNSFPRDIDWPTFKMLKNWINMGLIFHSKSHLNFQSKTNNSVTRNFISVSCKKCKNKYYVRDADIFVIKKNCDDGKFKDCFYHQNLEMNSRQIKKSKEYVSAVNKLYREGYSKDYSVIMKHIDNNVSLFKLK